MAGRIIAQLIIAGGQIFGRAFAQAYRQAAANAAKGGAAGAQQKAKAASSDDDDNDAGSTAKTASRPSSMMSADEARKVLGLEPNAKWEDVLRKYDHLFEVTDKKNGGNMYLQSKVYRAKESLELDYPEAAKAAAAPPKKPDDQQNP